VLFLYPFLVFFLLDEFGVRSFAFLLALALMGRIVPSTKSRPWLLLTGLVSVTVFLLILIRSESELLLMLYPALISCVLFVLFARTLFSPPSMIELISIRMGMPVPEKAVGYMRVLTAIWCGFFVFNGAVATWLAVGGDFARWALYNGLVSYVLIGVLLVGEYVFRQFYRRRHGITD